MPTATRLLVVDDDDEARAVAERFLTGAGHDVVALSRAEEVLARLRKDAAWYALVTDKDMPGLTGLELARLAHEIAPALAVVVMTGHAERLPADSAPHIDAYVAKPFRTPQELPEAVRHAREVRDGKVRREEAQRTLEGLKRQLTPSKS
jgi:DNA-binding NtrC family response regulator